MKVSQKQEMPVARVNHEPYLGVRERPLLLDHKTEFREASFDLASCPFNHKTHTRWPSEASFRDAMVGLASLIPTEALMVAHRTPFTQ